MTQSVITRHDLEHFAFREYRKHGTTKLSNETLEVGQRVQTLEGEYACGELSRLAIDAKGNVYPVAESVFAVSYEPAGADPPAEIARLKASKEDLRVAGERLIDQVLDRDAEIARLRADVERLREVLDEARTTCRRAAAMFAEIYGEDRSANERWCRATMEAITAALADTADTKGLNDG